MKRPLIFLLLSTVILGGLSSDSQAQELSGSETALSLSNSYPDRQLSNSLLPHTSIPSPGADIALVAALDGTIHLVDTKIGKLRWSFSSGQPIYSSYQAPFNRSNDDPASASEIYLDVGEDWQLYFHGKRLDKKVKLPISPDEYIRKTPIVTENGGVTLGNKRTTVFVLDAKSGKLVYSYRSDDSGSKLGSENDEQKAVMRVHTSEELLDSASETSKTVQHLLYIMRTDYVVQYYSSGEVLWNVAFADIEAEFRCQGKENSLSVYPFDSGNELTGGYLGDIESALPCQTKVLVNRLRDNSLMDFLSLPGGFSKLLLPDSSQNFPLQPVYQLAPLGKEDRPDISRPLPGRNDRTALSLTQAEFGNSRTLGLPDGSVTEVNKISTFAERFIGFFSTAILMLKNTPLVLFIAILSIIGFFFYRLKQRKLNKQAEEPKVQVGITRKKKSRRSGNNKSSTTSGKIQKSISNEIVESFELPYVEGNEKKSLLTLTDLVDGQLDGRRIGKLLVSNKEIAKGSNGTVVLEGIYDGRPVAVKRLVQTHHDVALKEIQNLIASDQHPNIVRWYGMEFDQDFVYLSLERCTCSLNDFIYVLSGTFQSKTISEDQDSKSLDEFTVRLHMVKENNKDVELWKPNGYPSTQLLKLMRDMVSGLSHLHDLGIIHRDLKPQNVLIIKERSLCAKLSDMGISKRLHGDMTSLTQNATGCGSSGWQAPEQLLQGRQTRAVDLFSLGCVLFFCITGGKHPYGDSFERDVNIVNDRKDLFLVETIPEAVDLFLHLLDPNPDMRPKAQDVLYHPFFWTSEMRLSFLRDVSDRFEDKKISSELLEALEGIASVALNGKWDEKMDSVVMDDILQRRRYKYDSIRDLLRVIRNKSNHYQELPPEVQELLGPFPEGYYNYFCIRFPKLLIEVYNVIYKYCREEEIFQKYIKSDLI